MRSADLQATAGSCEGLLRKKAAAIGTAKCREGLPAVSTGMVEVRPPEEGQRRGGAVKPVLDPPILCSAHCGYEKMLPFQPWFQGKPYQSWGVSRVVEGKLISFLSYLCTSLAASAGYCMPRFVLAFPFRIHELQLQLEKARTGPFGAESKRVLNVLVSTHNRKDANRCPC